jgi:hypothetical protein
VFSDQGVKEKTCIEENEVTGGRRKLHNEELHNLLSLPSTIRKIKSRRIRLAQHVARMWEKKKAWRILVGELEGKKTPLGTPRRRWVGDRMGWHGLN